MEGRKFLILSDNEIEQADIKEVCESLGYSCKCSFLRDYKKYIDSISDIYTVNVVLDIDQQTPLLHSVYNYIAKNSSNIFLISLSNEHIERIDLRGNASLYKPLSPCVLDMILKNCSLGNFKII